MLRIFLGLVFLASASAKLMDIDHVELYVYGLGLFSFDQSTVIIRLVISAELFLGLGLVIGLFKRLIWWLSLLLLLFFTLFLIADEAFGSGENCNCFGTFLSMKPWLSITRNLFLILLLFFCRQHNVRKKPWFNWIGAAILLSGVVIPFILSPPDFIYFKASAVEPGSLFTYHHCSDDARQTLDSLFAEHPLNGKKALCFYTTKCEFCQKLARKMSIMANRYDFREQVLIIYAGSPETFKEFSATSHSATIPAVAVPLRDLIRLTKGDLPTILVVEDSAILYRFGYRDLSERDVSNFFRTPGVQP